MRQALIITFKVNSLPHFPHVSVPCQTPEVGPKSFSTFLHLDTTLPGSKGNAEGCSEQGNHCKCLGTRKKFSQSMCGASNSSNIDPAMVSLISKGT